MPASAHTPEPGFMQQAIDLASENVTSGRGGPFGAVIVRAGEVVATGVNLVSASNDPTAHAEITAIRRAAAELGTFDLTGCELYSSCEPCPMCLAASYWARLEAIFFGASARDAALAGFDDSRIYKEVVLPHPERALPIAQMLPQQALRSFELWQTSPYKIQY